MSHGNPSSGRAGRNHEDRETPAIIMLVLVLILIIFVPLRLTFFFPLLLPLFMTMVVTAIIVLFRPCDPRRGVVAKMLLRLVAAALLTAAGIVVWFVYQFVTNPPTD